MRRLLAATAAVVVAGLAGVLGADVATRDPPAATDPPATATTPSTDAGTGEETRADAEPEPSAPSPLFGIAAGGAVNHASDADLARELDGYVAVGAAWIRVEFKWRGIEARRGRFDWTTVDRLVAAARSRGLDVVAILTQAPSWAKPGGTGLWWPPTEPADYARFAGAVAARYAPRGVLHYEIWNEPNTSAFWAPAPDATAYTRLLRGAYAAIEAAAPQATVLTGGLAPVGGYDDPRCDGGTSNAESPDVNPVVFLERMYAAGAKGHFDALAHHPYHASGFDVHRCSAWSQMAETSPSLRSILDANGDADTPLWVTEYGTDLAWVGGDEQIQAARLTEAFDRWQALTWPRGPMLYYTYRDTGCCRGMHMVRPDWTPRPVWYAYRDHPK